MDSGAGGINHSSLVMKQLNYDMFNQYTLHNHISDHNYISIIIPNYNRKKDILEALQSIYKQKFQAFEVIVVDDNSSDKSAEAIRQNFPDVKVIALDKNGGPAIARNIGIKATRGNIIVGIDSDVILPDNQVLTRIASKFMEFPALNCMAFRVINYYSQKDDTKTWWHPLSIDEYADKEFYTDYFSGSGYAFRKLVFETAGYYPEDLFMHGEEVDLAFRILDNGFDIVYCPSITVLHKVEEQSRNNLITFYYHRRNQIWIVAKYYPFMKGQAFMAPRIAKTLCQSLLQGRLITYLRSLRDGVKGLPAARKRRRPLKSETWQKIKQIRQQEYSPNTDIKLND